MSYCDFNPRLFKEFTSTHKKIKPGSSDLYTLYWSSSNLLSYVKPNDAGDLVCKSSYCAFDSEQLKVTDFREFNDHSRSNSTNEFIVDKCFRITLI